MTNKRLTKSIKKFSRKKEDKLVTISGMLGLPLNGTKTVSVPNRDGFVFVRLKDNTSEVIQAYNAEVSPIYDLPVLVTRQGNVYKVIGRNLTLYRDWGSVPYLPKHGGQHSFNINLGIGGDITWVFSQQFMPLLGYPSGSSMMLTVEPHVYEWEGQWKYAQNTGTPSFAPFVPTSGAMARMALLYIDGRDNSLNIAAGASFSNLITDPATLFTFLPDVPRSIGIPIAGVKLPTGTTSLEWTNVYDVRDFYTVGMSSGSAASNSIFIWDEGVLKGTATTLNVVGALSDISVSGSVARLFITGSGGGSNPNVQDEGSPLGAVDTFNFVGAGVSASVSGTAVQVMVTGTTPKEFAGAMWNGQISVTSISGSITIALKTLDNTDPSSSNPIFVRINNSIREIISALSVTRGSGTNWFNAGGAELATKEIDYFVYLIWNTNLSPDAVDIGFSRIPYGNVYGDFSSTGTDEKYLANGGVGPVSTDDVVNIGRFAATLSAASTFVWSVPTFTSSNLIQRPVFESRLLDFVSTRTPSAGSMSSVVVTSEKYQVIGRRFLVDQYFSWTQNTAAADYIQLTQPFTFGLSVNFSAICTPAGSPISSNVTSSGNSVYVRQYNAAGGAFTVAAGKDIRHSFSAALP